MHGGQRGRLVAAYGRSTILIGLVAVSLAAGALSAPLAAQAGAPTDRSPLVAAPLAPPGPIDPQDRYPVPAPQDENGWRDPPETSVTLPPGVSPEQQLTEATPLPHEGGPTFDVFGVGPEAASHVAEVFPQDVNQQDANGEWHDVRSQLSPDPGYGWKGTVRGVTVHFPTQLTSATPVRVDFPGPHSLTAVPEGVDATASSGGISHGAVTYSYALPATDFVYGLALGGYEEKVVLKSPAADGSLTYDIQTSGLTLQALPSGDLSVITGGQPIAIIAAPVATDSSAGAASSIGVFALDDLGSGNYRLHVTFDQGFLARATYPVTIDPETRNVSSDTSDTYVDSQSPGTDFSSSGLLWTSDDGANNKRYTYVRFDASGLHRADRLVYTADMNLYVWDNPGTGMPIDASRVTSAWPNPVTWNSQPSVGAVMDTQTFPGGTGWWSWDLKSMYQHVLDSNTPNPWTDYGVRVSTNPTVSYSFRSANSAGGPILVLTYNDLPAAPSLAKPSDGFTSTHDSPTLKLASIPADPNGDDVFVSFQISDNGTDWTGNHLVYESPWSDERSYVVPSGILVDGQTYYWRARSWDVCRNWPWYQIAMCSLTDGLGKVYSQPASAVRSFTISMQHFGEDARWAMWSHDLGNGMSGKVNESNGNLYLNVPLDTLSTAIGDLSIGLSYNSLLGADQITKGYDYGLSPGWDLAIGPGSSARDLPVELVKLPRGNPDFPDAGVEIRFGGGRVMYFPHRDHQVFAASGSGAGVVRHNVDGATPADRSFFYRAADGSTYTFSNSGKLTEASPVAAQPSSGANDYKYTYTSGALTQVTDPLNRAVTLSWSSGKLQSISTWAGQSWQIGYNQTTGRLNSISIQVTNSSTGGTQTEALRSSYFTGTSLPGGLLKEIDNGVTQATGRTGWLVSYATNADDAKATQRVYQITAPPGGASSTPTPWTFQYQGPYSNQTVTTACITDPLATPAPSFCTGSHQTKVDFNTASLPIRIGGPADQTGYWPVTTEVWDSNNNMICNRTPAANAVAEIVNPNPCKNDQFSSVFTYQVDPPYQMLTATYPANANGGRRTQTYQYDSDTAGQTYNGLWVEKYGNKDFAGVPADEAVWSNLDASWGSGAPPGVPGGGDNWSMRWSGYLNLSNWTDPQKVSFRLTTHDEGASLTIGSVNLFDCVGTIQQVGTYNCGTGQDAKKTLWPGLRPITIEYSDLSGDASFKLEWDQGNGSWQVIPASRLQTNLGLLTRVTTSSGGNIARTSYSFPDDDSKARRLPDSVTTVDLLPSPNVSRETDYKYNQYGQVWRVTTAAGTSLAAMTTNTYTNNATTSCLTQTQDPTGAITTFACDAAGDVTQMSQQVQAVANQPAQTRTTSTEYDSLGRITKVTNPAGGYTITTYDQAGRPIQLDQYLGTGAGHDAHAYTNDSYDDAGHLLTEQLPLVKDPASGLMVRPTITHVYDWLDDETSTTDARGKTWLSTYDSLRRVIERQSPTGLVTDTENRRSES